MDNKKRFTIQTLAALVQNANLKGFFTGRIYTGAAKGVCVPGLNCYSCPGAVGACPIGSLQSFLGARPVRIPYYVVGLLVFFGALLGRAVCGFLCPMGWLQELLHRVPFPKKLRDFKADRALRKLKYLVLALLVVLPLFFALTPFFCKYLCPLGAVYGLFNRFALWRGELDADKCVRCGACAAACRMGVEPTENVNSAECIRCGDCVRARMGFRMK